MPPNKPSQAPSSGGIHVGDVGGSVNFRALGDIVGGDKIVNITTTIQISVEAVTQRPLITASPYRGLDHFEDRDRDLFFGRDQLIKDLLAKLSTSNVLLVLGASGSGKSSVVRAGLLPALSRLLGAEFRSFTLVPDVNPFESLRSSLHSAGFSQSQTCELADAQSGTASRLIHALQSEGEQWLVFIDQFEEIFTRSEDSLRQNFIAALLAIVHDTASSTKLVLAMRADFLDLFGSFPEFAKLIEKNITLVTDMHVDELRLAIEQPAAQHGVVFDKGLVEEIIKDVQDQAGSLPLLQYTLNLLWEEKHRRDGLADRHLHSRAYRELGGVRGALQKRADQIFAGFGDPADPKRASAKQEIVCHIFLRLVDIAGVGSDDAMWRPLRRRAAMAIFTTAQEKELLQELIDQKLLVSDREGTEATVEVAHESLFTSWDRLKKWIEGGKQVIFVKNRLADDAHRWKSRQEKDSASAEEELLSGSRLAQALDMLARGDFTAILGGLGSVETQFLDVSAALRDRRIQEQQDRQQRELKAAQRLAEAQKLAANRLRKGLMVAIVLLLATAVVGAVAFSEWRHVEREWSISEARVLAAEARTQFGLGRHLDGLISAMRAGRILRKVVGADSSLSNYPTVAPLLSLQMILDNIYERNRIEREVATNGLPSTSQKTAAVSERLILVDGNRMRVGSLTPEQLQQIMGHERPILAKSFTPDGKYLITAGADGTVRIRELLANKPAFIIGLHGGVNEIAFAADGKQFTTKNVWGEKVEWDMSRQNASRHATALVAEGTSVVYACYDPNGSQVATAATDGSIRLWSTAGQQIGHPVVTGQKPIVGIAFDNTGSEIISIGANGPGKIWKLSPSHVEDAINLSSIRTTIYAAYSGGAKQIAALFAGSGAAILSSSSSTLIPIGQSHQDWILGAAWCPNGNLLVTGGADDTIRFWTAAGGEAQEHIVAHQDRVNAVSMSVDGVHVASAGGNGTVKVWTLTGQLVAELVGHKGAVLGVEFSPDGKLLASTGQDGTVRIWTQSGEQLAQFAGFHGALNTEGMGGDFGCPHICFSPDGRTIAIPENDEVVQLWRMQGLDELLDAADEWLKPYLDTHESERRRLLQNGER